jgi:hypothetical protein
MKYLIKILITITNVLLLLNKCLVEAQCSTDCQTLQSIKPTIKYLTNTLNTKYPPVQCSIQCPNNINCTQFINSTLADYTFSYSYFPTVWYYYQWYKGVNNIQIKPYYDSNSNSIIAVSSYETIYSWYNFLSVNIYILFCLNFITYCY